MKNTASIVWLIIFLCTILIGIYTLWGYGWHLRKTEDLRKQVEDLTKKIEQLEKEKGDSCNIAPLASPLATPSASPASKSLASPRPEPRKESTRSGTVQ